MIFFRDMSADADGKKSMQAGLLAALSAAIAKDAVAAEDQDVRDKLLVALVLLGVSAVQIQNLRGRSHRRQIFLHVETEPVKNAKLFKKLSLEAKHSFFCCHWLVAFRVVPS